MQTAQYTDNLHAPFAAAPHGAAALDADLCARLTWLANANAEAERYAQIFRTPREEQEARLMRRPLTTEEAFARFGLLLGTLPPAAIFSRILFMLGAQTLWLAILFVPMLLVCALVGRNVGAHVGSSFDRSERGSWARTLVDALEDALIWAAETGAAGGAIFFGIGAIFGFVCAIPVALVAFALFAPLHRLLARGGMIDARHLLPLAWGINLTIAALILSPHVIPY